MDFFNSFKKNLFFINPHNFNQYALKLFKYQAIHNQVYKDYIRFLGIKVKNINEISNIPFLPIEFFKTHEIKTSNWQEEKVFMSSGTTGQELSSHFVEDLDFYLKTSEKIFQNFYGPVGQYHVFGLLPSYLERENSSLIYMVDHFIKSSGSDLSGFYLHNYRTLVNQLQKAGNKKILLLGVTFALLDMAEQHSLQMPNLIVMETGGMKGRRPELVREEVHRKLKEAFHCDTIHSEYGMTELMSQAYSFGDGKFRPPPWMKVFIREINDPFQIDNRLKQGGINIIDLANYHSCAFIETKDLGRVNEAEGYFEPLGRFDNSDARGCNLMVV
jgi:hypothetical protein